MPSGGLSTFDGNPNASPATTVGYRPGLPDFNGAALADDPVNPPDPQTMPTSALLNTYGKQLVSYGKVVACAGVGVNAGASPTFQYWTTAANLIVSNPFTLTRVGAGNYQITYAANLLPIAGWPQSQLNAVLGAHNYAISAVNIANGVQVYTVQDGALADLNFSVSFI